MNHFNLIFQFKAFMAITKFSAQPESLLYVWKMDHIKNFSPYSENTTHGTNTIHYFIFAKNVELKEQENNLFHNNQEAFGNYLPPPLIRQQANKQAIFWYTFTGRSPNRCIPVNHGAITPVALQTNVEFKNTEFREKFFSLTKCLKNGRIFYTFLEVQKRLLQDLVRPTNLLAAGVAEMKKNFSLALLCFLHR